MRPLDASLPGCLSHLCEVVCVRQLPAHLEANDDDKSYRRVLPGERDILEPIVVRWNLSGSR